MALTLRIHTRLEEVPPDTWDALRPDRNPFLSHAFLAGLERHGCVRNELGWQGWHLVWYRDQQPVAAMPAYLKGNSHGEFVFDWSWAQACEQSGGRYYPKLVCAVPYTPVSGPRLLAGPRPNQALLRALVDALVAESRRLDLSGAHVNFADAAARSQLRGDARWLPRHDIQFHWRNQGYRDFDDFLDALNHKKRKNIRQERQRLMAAGWTFQRLSGGQLGERDWRFVHALYVRTFAEKGNYPALSETFFRHLGETLHDQVMVSLAHAPDGRPAAMALFLHDHERVYGRYWGCLFPSPGLHFECCYYQGIEYTIEQRMAAFEPGAQGEHKLARGFLPVLTSSFHHLRDDSLRSQVALALARERAAVAGWYRDLMARSPYARAAE
jgi:uncharacterized protein